MLTLLIFAQPVRMPEMSYSMGLCSQNGPFFTSLMNPIAEKYRFVFRSLSTILVFTTSLGSGAFDNEPSSGVRSVLVIAGASCAEPKIYGMKEWSSSPQTPWEPAGSRVYVLIRDLTSSRYLDGKVRDKARDTFVIQGWRTAGSPQAR